MGSELILKNYKAMIADSILLFITSIISLNQSVPVEKQPSPKQNDPIEVVYQTTTNTTSSMRGGWDGN